DDVAELRPAALGVGDCDVRDTAAHDGRANRPEDERPNENRIGWSGVLLGSDGRRVRGGISNASERGDGEASGVAKHTDAGRRGSGRRDAGMATREARAWYASPGQSAP